MEEAATNKTNKTRAKNKTAIDAFHLWPIYTLGKFNSLWAFLVQAQEHPQSRTQTIFSETQHKSLIPVCLQQFALLVSLKGKITNDNFHWHSTKHPGPGRFFLALTRVKPCTDYIPSDRTHLTPLFPLSTWRNWGILLGHLRASSVPQLNLGQMRSRWRQCTMCWKWSKNTQYTLLLSVLYWAI